MKVINGRQYATKQAFALDADEQKLSREDLQNIYDALPNSQVVKCLRNRPYAIDRIWEVSPVAANNMEGRIIIPGDSKKAMVLRMLAGKGSTLQSIVIATGWEPHTTRGFLSTLRSKGGVNIESTRGGKVTTYRIIDGKSAAA